MNTEGYTYKQSTNQLVYTFLSLGKQAIPKVIVYEHIEDNVYNLAFGDYDFDTHSISDTVVSDNGDTIKVLATVIKTIFDFFVQVPDAELIIRGSSEVRTRLYQKIIRDNFEEISQNFYILAKQSNNQLIQELNFETSYTEFRILKKHL